MTINIIDVLYESLSLMRRPGFDPRSDHVRFLVDGVALGRFPPSTSFPPASSHSTDCSILIIYHSMIVQRAHYWPEHQVDSVSPHPTR
jgi:Zn-dependent M28 family amino/carboxypeptidase